MKIIALGDTHGRNAWKDVLLLNKDFDKLIFIGDYFDSFNISSFEQLSNFRDIIAYKKANMGKVDLLFGNHDYHYLRCSDEDYSGYQRFAATDISIELHKALEEDLLKMCVIHDNYMFTHAGVTKTWLSNTGYDNTEPIDTYINDLFKYKPTAFRFTPGRTKCFFGGDVTQPPTWVRQEALLTDMVDGYIQVVGHTGQDTITTIDDKLVLIDTIGQPREYLIIIDGVQYVSKLP